MSMKLKMVKALCVLTVISIVACASMTGFAASFTTTTVYVLGQDVVNVATEVTGVNPNEQVTYLVHDSQDVAIGDQNIIYIDQKEATGGGLTSFDFSTTKTRVGALSTTVLVGAQTSTVEPLSADDATISPYTITVADYENGTVSIANGTPIGKGQVIEFTASPADGYDLASLTIGGVDQTIIGETYSVTGDGDVTIAAVFAAQAGESTIDGSLAPQTNINFETPNDSYITTYGTVSIIAEDLETAKFGILFAVGEKTDAEMKLGEEGVEVYEALAAGTEGKFAVKLIDGGSGMITDQVYTTRVYMQIGDGEPVYGAIKVVNDII